MIHLLAVICILLQHINFKFLFYMGRPGFYIKCKFSRYQLFNIQLYENYLSRRLTYKNFRSAIFSHFHYFAFHSNIVTVQMFACLKKSIIIKSNLEPCVQLRLIDDQPFSTVQNWDMELKKLTREQFQLSQECQRPQSSVNTSMLGRWRSVLTWIIGFNVFSQSSCRQHERKLPCVRLIAAVTKV